MTGEKNGRYSTKGWYVRTAISVGRCFQELIFCPDGHQFIVLHTAASVSAIIAEHMNWFHITDAYPECKPRLGEYWWRFVQRDAHGEVVGSSVNFIAPMGADIHRIRAEHVEEKKRARRAAAERSEIRRDVSRRQEQPPIQMSFPARGGSDD